jgi:hypothetical protein
VDFYDIYSPKIFGSIGEIDDVLRDRSLCIILKKYPSAEITGTMKMQVFVNIYGEETVRLRSLAALSALTNFEMVYDVFCKTDLKFKSARDNEILQPLYALAQIVGDDYVKALDIYRLKSMQSAEYMDSQSTEGAINNVIKLLAQGWLNDQDLINHGMVRDLRYDETTDRYSLGEEVMRFDETITKLMRIEDNFIYLNSALLTLMANQTHDFGKISLHSVHNALHRIFSENEYQRSTVTFNSDTISEYFDKKKSFSCYNIKLDVSKYRHGKLTFDRIKEKMYDDETKDLTERMEKRKDHADDDIYSFPLGDKVANDN